MSLCAAFVMKLRSPAGSSVVDLDVAVVCLLAGVDEPAGWVVGAPAGVCAKTGLRKASESAVAMLVRPVFIGACIEVSPKTKTCHRFGTGRTCHLGGCHGQRCMFVADIDNLNRSQLAFAAFGGED